MELAPVAELYPSTTKPEFSPLDPAVLAERFSLAPGPCSLATAELGTPVDVSALGGNAAVAVEAPATAPGPKPAVPIKLKLKLVPKK